MAKSATKSPKDIRIEEVMKDSPQHLQKLLELRRRVAKSRSEHLEAKEYASECKKQLEGDRQKIENYLKDLNEDNVFDKVKSSKNGKEAAVKQEQTELNPVWPFPIPADLREVGLGDVSMNPNAKSFSSMIVASLADKGMKTAGDVEKTCSLNGVPKTPEAVTVEINMFLESVGKKQGCIVLNALAAVKANWKPVTKGKKTDWPFPVDERFAGHTIGQVSEKCPKMITTAAMTKLAESGYSILRGFQEIGDIKALTGMIGPGPAKKLAEAVGKYVAEAE